MISAADKSAYHNGGAGLGLHVSEARDGIRCRVGDATGRGHRADYEKKSTTYSVGSTYFVDGGMLKTV